MVHENGLIASCVGKWPSILSAAGLGDLKNKKGPCPLGCGGQKSFRFDNKEGRGTWICTHCGAGNGFTLLKRWLNISSAETMQMLEKLAPSAEVSPFGQEKATREYAIRLWREARAISNGDPAYVYLKRRVGFVPPVLRFHPAAPCDGERLPCMIAPVTLGEKVVALHRTYLTDDGNKANIEAPKRSLLISGTMKGGAIRLMPYTNVLGLAEGIETALAAYRLFGVPTWAAICASMLEAVEVPGAVREVVVFADNDASAEGQLSAFKLKKRLWKQVNVRVMIPNAEGTDWADVLAEKMG